MKNAYIAHHGILGQKWGIRRYQNYDGSYTQAGVKRYKESKANYDKKRSELKSLKEAGSSKQSIKMAKADTKKAKAKMNKDYKHLKADMMADKGKFRYQMGQTITNRTQTLNDISKASAMTAAGSQFLSRAGIIDQKMSSYITLGSAAVSGGAFIAGRIAEKGNKELRAYYTHTSKY